ncbi:MULTISPECIES: hypothetical protein [unclassified Streptomyces]|uniref:hypothetical protein n=1 Tax=unclassified Streptomyces TaxID=2593676 RepID=UPI00336A71EE
MRYSRLAFGGITSLAAVSLVGVLGVLPAEARGPGVTSQAATDVVAADRAVSMDDPEPAPEPAPDPDSIPGPGRPGKPGEEKPPRPPGTQNECFDIDTVRQEAAGGGAFYAAVSFGIPYVGDETSPGGPIDWEDLSDQGGAVPVGACGASIDVGPGGDGSDIFVDVITTSGTVHGITCSRTGSVITSCGTWVLRTTPMPGDTLGP